jgi:hypothetical protein
MTRLALKILTAIALALAVLAHAYAQGVTVTRAPQSVVMHDGTTGSPIKGADGKALTYPDVPACDAAALVMFNATPADVVTLKYRCVQAHALTFTRNCDGVPKPAQETFTVTDPDGVVYAGPYCAPGETCTTPADWNSSSSTYTDVGSLRINADGTVDLYRLVNVNQYPRCWEWQWQAQSEPTVHVVPDSETWVPELAPDALADNGSGDPSWPGHVPPVKP